MQNRGRGHGRMVEKRNATNATRGFTYDNNAIAPTKYHKKPIPDKRSQTTYDLKEMRDNTAKIEKWHKLRYADPKTEKEEHS